VLEGDRDAGRPVAAGRASERPQARRDRQVLAQLLDGCLEQGPRLVDDRSGPEERTRRARVETVPLDEKLLQRSARRAAHGRADRPARLEPAAAENALAPVPIL